jgi:hypothetical protein
MTNFTNNFEKFTARSGLYRVWVPLHDDGRAPLISIWIDPAMTAFERQQRHEDVEFSGVSDGTIAEETEGSEGNINDATFGKVVKAAPPRISQAALKFNF